MSRIILITIFYFVLYLFFERELYIYRTMFGWEVSRFFTILENRLKNPKINIFRRILGDFTRCYLSTAIRMMWLQDFSIMKLLVTAPKCFTLLAAAYLISDSCLNKWYKNNRVSRTLYNMEYQHLKSHAYIKFIYALYNACPTRHILNNVLVDLGEGIATNSVYVFEEILVCKKPNFSSIYRNCKVYLALNIVTVLYFVLGQNMVLTNYHGEPMNCTKLYEDMIFLILFTATCDKLQTSFKETGILKRFFNWILAIFQGVRKLLHTFRTYQDILKDKYFQKQTIIDLQSLNIRRLVSGLLMINI